jgi:hypothetical protein
MKKLALLFVVSFLFVACQQTANPESHLAKMDWEKHFRGTKRK